jgi:hypothetical protein
MKKEIRDINGSIIYSGDFESDKTCLEDAVKNNVRLRGAKLRGAKLRGAKLQGAKLRGADLRQVDFRGADLRQVDFRGADLRQVDFRGADLRGADLWRANLNGVNLDFSVLPLWCGGQFKADNRICKQILAHAKRIMELSEEGSPELHELMAKYIKGWHRESEF